MPLPTTEAELAAYLAEKQLRPVPGSAPQQPALPVDTPEAVLLARIVKLASDHGWLAYHVFYSQRSAQGWPDLTLAKPGNPGRLLFAELKSRTGKPTHEQEVWLDILRHTIPGIEVYVWRPADWVAIQEVLTWKHGKA